jgi:hypothetical protein
MEVCCIPMLLLPQDLECSTESFLGDNPKYIHFVGENKTMALKSPITAIFFSLTDIYGN